MGLDPQGRPGFYDLVHPEYTVLDRRSHNMASLNTEYDRDFAAFYRAMSAALDRFEADGTLTASREDSVLLSCVPWFSYTGLSFQMKSSLNFLRPMFVWGRYQARQDDLILPFTLQVHHGAADGYHCHLFFQTLEQILAEPEPFLAWPGTP